MQWREDMEKGKKKLIIKILSTVTVLAVAIAICTFVAKRTTEEVEASTKIMKRVSDKYKSGDTFKILEVVPEHTVHENEEIGYFMEDSERDRDFMQVSKAKSIGSFLDAEEGISNLLMMRDYGLIKAYDVDYGNRAGHVSDNPVYSDKATFANTPRTGLTLLDKQRAYVYGIYENDLGMSGDYKLADGYFIDNSGTINVIQGVVSGNSPVVSNNDIGSAAFAGTLSVIANTDGVADEGPQEEKPSITNQDEVTVTVEDEEEPEAPKENEENDKPKEQVPQDSDNAQPQPGGNVLHNMEEGMGTDSSQGANGGWYYQRAGVSENSYEPVEEGNRFDRQLPEGVTYVGDGTGNIRFKETSLGKYFGHPESPIYYTTDENNYFHNGGWFKELVFGDKDININISIETKTPSEITSLNAYDLIYISGRNETYVNKSVDLSDSQVMELYNAVVSNSHKAVIMDYALIDSAIVEDRAARGNLSNVEKLALLLWQKNQTAILTETLSENGAGGVANNGFDISIAGNGEVSLVSYGSVSNSVWHYLATTAPLSGYGNFVAGSVYVYEHRLQLFNNPKAQMDALDFFGNGDFNSAYTEAVIAAGLSQVEYMVQVNNANNPTERMNEQVTPAVVVQYILSYDGTASELVKHDLRVLEIQPCRDFSFNMGWGTQTKSDIEQSQNRYKDQCLTNRRNFIIKYLGVPFVTADGASVEEQNFDRVRFTSMTVDEFICNDDNILENYDIIYIGSNHSPNPAYKTYTSGSTGNYKVTRAIEDSGKSADTPAYITDFRDNLMDGMVYFNIGDMAYYSEALPSSGWGGQVLWGFLEDESGNKVEYSTKGRTRFVGRDLTVYKMRELLDYLDTGYPIIVAGDMLKTDDSGNRIINPTINTNAAVLKQTGVNGIDHGRIDNCSVMYEFFQVATGQSADLSSIGNYSINGYQNFISEGDAPDPMANPAAAAEFKEGVIQAVNAAKLSMNVTSRPTEYEYTLDNAGAITAQQTLKAESDGKYYLEFEFTLQNFSVNSTDSDIYTPKLYVDVNADGKFSESEQLEGAVVTNALTGIEVPHATTVSGSVYELSTNVLYRLRREVPDGYQGALPWCLKVEKSLNPNVSASETGYSAIKGEEPVTINILQITHNTQSTLNLNSMPGLYGRYIYQLDALDMFKLNITTVKQDEFVSAGAYQKKDANGNPVGAPKRYYEGLDDFDMLVLGFGDNYADTRGDDATAQAATDAIAEYIANGKPVLLTHDFMSHYPYYKVVKTLRDVLGMDRYGLTASGSLGSYVKRGTGYSKEDPSDNAAISTIEGSGRRVAYQPGSNKKTLLGETQGLTNYLIMKFYKDINGNTNKKSAGNDYFSLLSPDMYNWGHPPASNSNQEYLIVVDKVNDGQITNYPYKLPDAFPVNRTHGQYFQPNMEADQDEDGTADITIWYTLAYGTSSVNQESNESKLSDGVYNISPKDGVNHYYIFNSGNVTYTGSGHSSLITPQNMYEAQLFINTLVAAYRAGIRRPTVSIYEGSDLNSAAISNIVVPYDEMIGLNATTSASGKSESSFIRDKNGNYIYPFVSAADENATRVWFRVSDPNLIKGTKKIQLKFWQEVPSGTAGAQQITLENGETVNVIERRMPFYSNDFRQAYAYGTDATGGVMYGLKLPMDLLTTNSDFKLYVEAETTIESVSITGKKTISTSGKSYTSLGVTKMDLLKLD